MNKSNRLEIVGILSLSLILTASFSVSSCLPGMLETFKGYSLASLELVMTLPAISMTVVIAISSILSKYINERVMIVTGLLIYGISGITPVFLSSYPILFICRILMGVGTGLINAKAVSLIGERFTGTLQQKLQGIRCSMETLGQATLTLIVSFLLPYGWKYSFSIYGVAFLILLMYLLFVPASKHTEVKAIAETSSYKITAPMWRFIIGSGALGMLFISSAMLNTLRVTSFIVDIGAGTDVHGATILSISTFAGFLGGFLFGPLIGTLKKYMLSFSTAMLGFGILIIVWFPNLIGIAVGASVSSFFITNCTSYVFSQLSEHLPTEALVTANSVVLVGCNLGSSSTAFVLQIVGTFLPKLSAGFVIYGSLLLLVALGMFIKTLLNSKKSLN